MGSSSSRRRGRMDNNAPPPAEDAETGEISPESSHSGTDSESSMEENPGLSMILSYLIRSGQLQVSRDSEMREAFSDENLGADLSSDDDSTALAPPTEHTRPTPMKDCELKQEILLNSGQCLPYSSGTIRDCCLTNMAFKREVGQSRSGRFSPGDKALISSAFLPNVMQNRASYLNKAFCGTYSKDGDVFLSACQDQKIRIYNTRNGRCKLFKTVTARDVGWSVLDTAFSPDGNYLIYSSWSDSIHLCNVYGEESTHTALNLCPDSGRFCVFSLMFSQDNKEILGGASDRCLYVYDRDSNQRTLQIYAHEDDVNAVSFADGTSQILYSGGDDGLVKVWDRRTLSEETPVPVGCFAGHSDGITFINSKDDGRYLLSNSKDQSIKLWDIRQFSGVEAQNETKRAVAKQKWDYRWQQRPRKMKQKIIPGDTSLMTYRGHSVLHTLIRARFSPIHSTGQRYIYTGCASGNLIIYDVITGKIERDIGGQRACVRDVSWHPYENIIMSTSWDGTVCEWYYGNNGFDIDFYDSEDAVRTASSPLRRSERIRQGRRHPVNSNWMV